MFYQIYNDNYKNKIITACFVTRHTLSFVLWVGLNTKLLVSCKRKLQEAENRETWTDSGSFSLVDMLYLFIFEACDVLTNSLNHDKESNKEKQTHL